MLREVVNEVIKILNGVGLDIKIEDIEVPPDPSLGDLAFPCFSLAKKFKKSPNEVSKEISEKIKISNNSFIEKSEAVGPYVNFFLNKKRFADYVVNEVRRLDDEFGHSNIGKGKKIMVEYPAPNTNKPLHLGHMRNMAIGESVSRLFEALGFKVYRVNLHNDRGIHICKSMLAYKKWGKNKVPDKKPDHFVGDFYVLFSQKSKEDPKLEDEARDMLRKWESGDKETIALWKKLTKWVEDGFEETYKRFGVRFDKIYRESETYKKGKEMVLEGLKKGIFKRDETGAIYFDMSKYGLDKKILIRSDGTTLYITQDIYLAYLKYKEFKIDKSVYVVGNEQNYHFDVLFKILDELKKLGYEFAPESYHLSYGMVFLPSGKMKSREGTVVDADDFMDEIEEMAMWEIKKRNKIDDEKLGELSRKISLGAIKFFLLKYDEHKDFVFNPEESLSFEGETGPYLQYSLVRAKKILEKSGSLSFKNLKFSEPEEFELVKKISEFPGIVESAGLKYKPHLLANYAYELASLFSKFYEKCSVLQADEPFKSSRLALVWAFMQTMENCLKLLGIDEVDMM
ncbi:MAG: arginine--tRNA ligase [Candidatus Aenigmarchaeota archaeon]|nr:arginine--tRNA ligase [Candidatus Aenigmarchaeota archaeon]